ncbi:MAG: PQQ-dependent sugar dehydrogenase, partial [Verrucomicrobia bacterium]|nr:PQQ-dependent sugar dehydrogenase [Verrucomicrobiota bacterium]
MIVLLALAWARPDSSRGALVRQPNTTLRMPQEIQRTGFIVTNAFPGHTFDLPIAMATPPGETNRLFVLQRRGQIIVLTNVARATRTVFIELTNQTLSTSSESGLLGIAFHPGYAT